MNTAKKLRIVDASGNLLEGEPSTGDALAVRAPAYVEPTWESLVEARVTRHPDRAAWLMARASGIGGSEAALVLGAAPSWGSPYKLWTHKTGLVERVDEDNPVLRFGRVMEPHIAAEYQRMTGRTLIDQGDWAIRQHASISCMFATHDRIIAPIDDRGPGILSIKTSNAWKGIEWLEHEEPPLPYQIQFQHELACSGFKWGSFAVLIWGQELRWIDAVRNDTFIEVLEDENQAFWRRVISGEAPPIDGSEHTTEALRRLYPDDKGPAIVLPPEVAEWAAEIDHCNKEAKRLTERKDELNNKVRALLGDAGEGYVQGAGGLGWTYRLEGAKPGGIIPEQKINPYAGHRVLRRKGKKGKAA